MAYAHTAAMVVLAKLVAAFGTNSELRRADRQRPV